MESSQSAEADGGDKYALTPIITAETQRTRRGMEDSGYRIQDTRWRGWQVAALETWVSNVRSPGRTTGGWVWLTAERDGESVAGGCMG